jgi:hypothetical protein
MRWRLLSAEADVRTATMIFVNILMCESTLSGEIAMDVNYSADVRVW